MIGAVLCIAAFAATFLATRRRLVTGVGLLLAVGYAYGIVRARFHDGASHFLFDAALLGLYAAHFTRRPSPEDALRGAPASGWVKALLVIPLVMFFVPLQHPLVQLVGLRAAVVFLPMVVIGARLRADDVSALGHAIAVLNLVVFAFAALEVIFGIEPFFPYNAVTAIIYRSSDVGVDQLHRIPATFSSAHAYAGSMLSSLPLLAAAWVHPGRRAGTGRVMVASAIGAAFLGIFASGARLPVVLLVVLAAAVFLDPRASRRARLGVVAIAIVLSTVVLRSDRFQRFTTLSDASFIERRVYGSTFGFVDVVLSYPLGAGLARAVGTSIPFFLTDFAEPQIGLENEYSRLIVDQGLAGALLWILFVVWLLRRRVPLPGPGWALPYRLVRVYVALTWLSGMIGTGLLLSIPQSAFLLLQMGMLSAAAAREEAMTPTLVWLRHWGRAA